VRAGPERHRRTRPDANRDHPRGVAFATRTNGSRFDRTAGTLQSDKAGKTGAVERCGGDVETVLVRVAHGMTWGLGFSALPTPMA
jgi:hypothetical protein